MKNWLILVIIGVIVVGAIIYMSHQNGKNQELLAQQLSEHQTNTTESVKGSVLDFAATIIPSLLDQLKEKQKEKQLKKEVEAGNAVEGNPAIFPTSNTKPLGPWAS